MKRLVFTTVVYVHDEDAVRESALDITGDSPEGLEESVWDVLTADRALLDHGIELIGWTAQELPA